MLEAIVPVSYVVAVLVPRNVPGLEVPKYTSCDVAPEPAVQLRSYVTLTLVAPLAGVGLLAAPGGGGIVVKLQTKPIVVPPVLCSSIRQ